MASYIGNPPVVSATRTVTEVIATAGQTVFTANGGYTVGYVDVLINGVQLQSFDFTATNGTTITLAVGCAAGDEVRIVAYGTFLVSSALPSLNPSYTGTLTGGTDIVNIGSGQFYKDASGNVGIGTSSPNAPLTVRRTGSGTGVGNQIAVRVEAATAGADNSIQFSDGATGGIYVGQIGDALRFSTNNTERARITATGDFQFNSGYGSVATVYGCRAWVNFNGTGTVAIRASGNVSSITDNGVGDYTVNFTTAMPDTSYAFSGAAGYYPTENNAAQVVKLRGGSSAYIAAGSVRIVVAQAASGGGVSLLDCDLVALSIFR